LPAASDLNSDLSSYPLETIRTHSGERRYFRIQEATGVGE
jgi:hypothetical protein